jgi:hypothetical protein
MNNGHDDRLQEESHYQEGDQYQECGEASETEPSDNENSPSNKPSQRTKKVARAQTKPGIAMKSTIKPAALELARTRISADDAEIGLTFTEKPEKAPWRTKKACEEANFSRLSSQRLDAEMRLRTLFSSSPVYNSSEADLDELGGRAILNFSQAMKTSNVRGTTSAKAV